MTEDYRILLAGINPELTEEISNTLRKKHCQIAAIPKISNFTYPIRSCYPDLVIMDPSSDGSAAGSSLREFQERTHIPVIIISSASDISAKVHWLEAGADDYLSKPFDHRELAARVHAVLRRSALSSEPLKPEPPKAISYPDLTVDLNRYAVTFHGEKVSMPPKEIELLYCLASQPGRVLTREHLLTHIWGYNYVVDSRTIDVHIKRLRRKLLSELWTIETVWGVGYNVQLA